MRLHDGFWRGGAGRLADWRLLVALTLRSLMPVVAVLAVLVLAPGVAGAATFSWAAPTSVSREPFTQVGTSTGISCPATSLCVAVDQSGNSVTSTDPTATTPTWTTDEIDPDQLDQGNGLDRPPGLQGIRVRQPRCVLPLTRAGSRWSRLIRPQRPLPGRRPASTAAGTSRPGSRVLPIRCASRSITTGGRWFRPTRPQRPLSGRRSISTV